MTICDIHMIAINAFERSKMLKNRPQDMPRTRLELVTRGFSVLCSTDSSHRMPPNPLVTDSHLIAIGLFLSQTC